MNLDAQIIRRLLDLTALAIILPIEMLLNANRLIAVNASSFPGSRNLCPLLEDYIVTLSPS